MFSSTRSSYLPEDLINPKSGLPPTDNNANAFSGIFSIQANNCEVFQHNQILAQENMSGACTCDNQLTRTANYGFGNTITWNYLGSANNGVWTSHGMTFITGDTVDSTPKNLYGSASQNASCGKGFSDSQSASCKEDYSDDTTPSISIKFELPPIDPVTFGTDVSSVQADIGPIYLAKGVSPHANMLDKVINTQPLNLVLNPNFYFDPTNSSVESGEKSRSTERFLYYICS